jgi:hypothetical protein
MLQLPPFRYALNNAALYGAAAAPGWGGAAMHLNIALRPGNFHAILSQTALTVPAGGGSANNITATPLLIPRNFTLTKLVTRVSTAAAGSVRVALYADNGAGQPGLLIADSGDLSGASTGTKEATVSGSGGAGPYWLCTMKSNVSIVQAGWNADNSFLNLLGLTAAGVHITSLSRAFTYGAYPADESLQVYTASTGAVLVTMLAVA